MSLLSEKKEGTEIPSHPASPFFLLSLDFEFRDFQAKRLLDKVDALERIRNALDDGLGPRDAVPGRVNVLVPLHHEVLVDVERAPLRGGKRREVRQVGDLRDRLDDHVALEHELRARDGLRGRSPAFVGLAELLALQLEPRDLALAVGQHLERRHQREHLDALLFGLDDFVLRRGHLAARSAVDDGRLGAETACNAHRVERRKPGADDGDVLSDVVSAPQVHRLEERDDVLHADGVVAGDVEVLRLHRAEPQEHGVVLGTQLLEVRDLLVQTHLAAEVEHTGRILEQRRAGEAVRGNAQRHHPADLGLLLVDHDLVAVSGQLVCGGEPGRPRADDGNALAGGGRARDVVSAPEIRSGSLQQHDGERLALLGPDAVVLALVRTHTAADVNKRVDVGDDVEGFREVSLLDRADVLWDRQVCRARGDALGVSALYAAGSFHLGFFGSEAKVHFLEVLDSMLRFEG